MRLKDFKQVPTICPICNGAQMVMVEDVKKFLTKFPRRKEKMPLIPCYDCWKEHELEAQGR